VGQSYKKFRTVIINCIMVPCLLLMINHNRWTEEKFTFLPAENINFSILLKNNPYQKWLNPTMCEKKWLNPWFVWYSTLLVKWSVQWDVLEVKNRLWQSALINYLTALIFFFWRKSSQGKYRYTVELLQCLNNNWIEKNSAKDGLRAFNLITFVATHEPRASNYELRAMSF
jgi:hypothetical protein